MKKFLSLFLVLIIALSCFSVSAMANYCELFDKTLSSLTFVDEFGNESKPWSANSIGFITIRNIEYWDYYNEAKSDVEGGMWECYSIPKATFEEVANKLFDVKVDLTTVNYSGMVDVKYDGSTATYDVTTKNAGGGIFYRVYGYNQSGNTYNVYLQQSSDGDAFEGYALAKCSINGNYVRIISCEEISSLPALSGLTTWPKEQTSTEVIGTVSKETATSSEETSSVNTESEVTSDVSSEITSDIVDIAEAEVLLDTKELSVSASKGVFPENTVVTAIKIETAEGIQKLNTALENIAKTYIAYDITAQANNVSVQPNGKVYATFNIPASFDIEKVMVLYVAEDGSARKVPYTIDKAGLKATAELTHFSTYAIIEATDDYLGTGSNGGTVAIIISIIVVLACGGFYAWYKLYYKKKLQK